MSRLGSWLFAVCFFMSGGAFAATSCANFYVSGKEPTLDASLLSRTTEVCHTQYVLFASGVTKGPLYSAEHLTAAQIAGANSISRDGSWHQETGIPTADRSQSSDYTNSGYDRGHMSPAGDPLTIAAEDDTFSMANVVPQLHVLNAGEWEKIEESVRHLATQLGEVYVVTGPAFSTGTIPTIGKDAVAVPEYTWKAVYEPGVGAAAFLCTNVTNYTCAVVSMDDVKTMSGVDPFPSLSASMKANPIHLTLP